ncbi:MAG: FtsX-like permease family protein [Bacteroidota bacterium]
MKWILKMAWRDSRSNRRKLFLYMAAIIVGVAAQVAITSFRENLNQSINDQAKELLGADLEFERSAPLHPEVQDYIDSIAADQSTALGFASMAYFPSTGTTRLSQITALEGAFPYFGTLETDPVQAASQFQQTNGALVEEPILIQFGLEVGDSVKIGRSTYPIVGALIDVPGQPAAAGFFGPRIYIPKQTIEETGLLQRGSRLEYRTFVQLQPNLDLEIIEERLRELKRTRDFDYDTVEERKEDIGQAITSLSNFLNLIGFVALLLGGIGVASSIFVYIRQKIRTIAVLRCIGASSNQALAIFLVQAFAMGLTGSVMGATLGSVIQLFLPTLVSDFIPVDIDLFLSWTSIGVGIATGVIVSVLFGLFPLLAVKQISPLFTLRSIGIQFGQLLSRTNKVTLVALVSAFITAYAWLMLNDWRPAVFFTIGLYICIGILWLFARVIMWGSRRFAPAGWSYEWRQGLANLYRPNNQTSTLLLTFGLGVTLISSLYLTQDMLLGTIQLGDQDNLPNLALFDIQYDQNDGVNAVLEQNGIKPLQNVPIVTMRLGSINGQRTTQILADTNRTARRWALNREYRSSYRDSLASTERLSEGEWIGSFTYSGTEVVPVSVSEDLMDDLAISVGDTLTWDVQGIPIQSYVASTRLVEWDQPSPNFFVIFPVGVLEPAPQFFATTLNTPNREASIALQQQIVQAYPNVSAIDIGQVIDTIRSFIDKITFVIQFIGLFSIATGLIVLAGSAVSSRYQRVRESVLLRTLGAVRHQVMKIQVIEYVLLGCMAALTGLVLSVGTSYLLGYFFFDIVFTPNVLILATEAAILILLVLLIGSINVRGIHHRTPLEILRSES